MPPYNDRTELPDVFGVILRRILSFNNTDPPPQPTRPPPPIPEVSDPSAVLRVLIEDTKNKGLQYRIGGLDYRYPILRIFLANETGSVSLKNCWKFANRLHLCDIPLPEPILAVTVPLTLSRNATSYLAVIDRGRLNTYQANHQAMEGEPRPAGSCSPAEVQLKLVCMVSHAYFAKPGLMRESVLDNALGAGKEILELSQRKPHIREACGFSSKVWAGLTEVLTAGIPVLEKQSFASLDPVGPNYNGSSSTLIAFNFTTLMNDLERVNDLCIIARNCLATKDTAQDLAASSGFDAQILKLIDVCVRVTARGYDGEVGTRSEEKWQKAVMAYKKLLVTCLQFLHNLCMGNERRKLILWLDLFCSSPPLNEAVDLPGNAPSDSVHGEPLQGNSRDDAEVTPASAPSTSVAPSRVEPGMSFEQGINNAVDSLAAEVKHLRTTEDSFPGVSGSGEPSTGGPTIPSTSPESPSASGNETSNEGHNNRHAAPQDHPQDPLLVPQPPGVSNFTPQMPTRDPDAAASSAAFRNAGPITDEDTLLARTPASAASTLRTAKEQLMARLRDNPTMLSEGDEENTYAASDDGEGQAEIQEEGDHRSSAAADGSLDDEEDYHGPGDQERGLLTDIPLILGPSEIEALPMIVQTGIVGAFGLSKLSETSPSLRNMQTVRCNIMLAQEAGRNLLRELLIFIAAWDMQDDDFYVKIMVQIVQAVLENGLLPFTYMTFGEQKDIISPAQAVIVKILTQIFRTKQSLSTSPGDSSSTSASQQPPYPSRFEVLMVRYLFTVFRQSIIPEACALIYLQGQIHAGFGHPEDFPLNLWDMERVYEGVYQFLEFFAVLTENEAWKALLVKWEIVNELITLLKELEENIPKGRLDAAGQADNAAGSSNQAGQSANVTTPVAVERPYDTTTSEPSFSTEAGAATETDQAPLDDPVDFEWRNLKKLVILVLSSLVWKSRTVQDQVRQYGGMEQILGCCRFDLHNPYIREHAIMCLRFLLEGNTENQQIVRELEPRMVVPSEVLDKRGYETFLDAGGKVGLRRKGAAAGSGGGASASSSQ
ncbi:MAG: hypothetical protein M1819_001746 [Sarea resinae]|nr:MAG: hypothetical protein M1819_001746 [Sarea resinae]